VKAGEYKGEADEIYKGGTGGYGERRILFRRLADLNYNIYFSIALDL
jgi:hypothetical protein